MLSKLAGIRKFLASAVGGTLTVLVFVTHNFGGFLPAPWTAALGVIVAVLTAVSTYLVPNTPAA